MDIKKKILLSSIAALATVSFTACGSDSSTPVILPDNTTNTTNDTNTNNDTNNNTPTVTVPATFTGDGKDDAYARFLANDATHTFPTAHTSHGIIESVDQAAIATLAAGKTEVVVNADITSNTTWTSGNKYKISGLVKVKSDATLTIEPGTIIYGEAGANYLVVTKGSDIVAEGTEANPIIFTSSAALTDSTSADVAQWGGLTILGDAPTNQNDPHYEVDESDSEFAFGGTTSNDSSGSLKHVYILNSGYEVATDLEINGLSLCGVGSGTTVENIHIENSSDDGIEIWGGTVNVTNIDVKNAQDDSIDLDYGYVGTVTNARIEQVETAHAGFEISSGGTSPMTGAKIVNFLVQKASDSDEGGIYIKDDSTAPTFVNGFVTVGANEVHGGIRAKKAMATDQKAALSFKDVILNAATMYAGDGAADAKARHQANDAVNTTDLITSVDQAAIATLAAGKTEVVVNADITSNTTWTSGNKYKISGLVKVKSDATLTIEPGTIIYGEAGANYLVVTKGSDIVAEGTEANPIIFTSSAALTDSTSADVAQWGGLTILGDAPTNQNDPHYEVDESDSEFAFGGTTSNDSSGSLKHVYILNSGYEVATDLEINGLSLCGVGSGTTVENIHIENSSDDGIEIWGGTVNVTNIDVKNAQDDSIDLDYGYVGTVTNARIEQVETAHAGFEISSGGTSPMTGAKIVNFLVQKASDSDEGGIYIKDDSTAPTFVNGFVTVGANEGHAAVRVKKAMATDQKAALSFKDVILK